MCFSIIWLVTALSIFNQLPPGVIYLFCFFPNISFQFIIQVNKFIKAFIIIFFIYYLIIYKRLFVNLNEVTSHLAILIYIQIFIIMS